MHVYVCASEKARAGGAGGAQQHAARPRPTPKAAPASTPRSPHAPRPGAQCPFVGCTPSSLCTRAADRARLCALQGPPGRNAPRHSPRDQSRPLWRHPSAAGAPSLPFPARSARIGGMTRHPTATTQHTRALGSDVRRSRTRKHIREPRGSASAATPARYPASLRTPRRQGRPMTPSHRSACQPAPPGAHRGQKERGERRARAKRPQQLPLVVFWLSPQTRWANNPDTLTHATSSRVYPSRGPKLTPDARRPGRQRLLLARALPPPLWRAVRVAWSCAPRRGPWCCGSA